MKNKFILSALLSATLLTACSAGDSNEDASPKQDVNIKDLVQEYSGVKMEDKSASITSKELLIKDENRKETTYDLTGEEFFVSIAPYVNETHP
ncbi:hypothetical protein J2S07_002453 [Robertmurraya andreesenii]|nr:hypothetical protein [Robertmurraya andreesenii]